MVSFVFMAATLTLKKIKKLYDSQWVLLAELQEDKYDRIKRAKVLWHSPDKDEVSRKAVELKPGKFAFLSVGEKT
jgi:2-polyprenyl-3-methyl-5-hydroxy-6-metoxy-1,4-benzoquinol methylase